MARDGSNTKKLIEQTALRLFVEKGVTATTIKDIAGTANIAEGTIYRHFPSKQQLAWELFAENMLTLAQELDRCQQPHQTLKEKLAAIINHVCAFHDADPILFRYLLLDHHGHIRKMAPDMPSPVRVLKRTIAQRMAAGEIPESDCDLMTAMILGLILQVSVFKVYGIIDRSLTSLAPTMVEKSCQLLGM